MKTILSAALLSSVFAANGGTELTQGYQRTKINVAGLEDHQINFEVKVYPNPSYGSITLNIPKQLSGMSYMVYSVGGKLIYQKDIVSPVQQISLIELPSASYFLKITQASQVLKTYKVEMINSAVKTYLLTNN